MEALRQIGSKNILIVHERVPNFDASGADYRLYQIIKILVQTGHRISLVGRSPDGLSVYRKTFEQWGISVFAPDPARMKFIADIPYPPIDLQQILQDGQYDFALLYCYFWSGISVGEQYISEFRQLCPKMPIVILSDDVHWFRELRRAQVSGLRVDVERSRGLRDKERFMLQQADRVLGISDEDIQKILEDLPDLHIRKVTHSNALLTEHHRSFSERDGLLFIGSGENYPNVQSIQWFIESVFPIVRKEIPEVVFHVIGKPPRGGWPIQVDNVHYVGHVTGLKPYLENARVFVAPMKYGTGIKTKNVQAFCASLPVVTTTIGAEGLHFMEGELGFVCDDPNTFAQSIVRLYKNESLWTACSTRAYAHAQEHFGENKTARDLCDVLEDIPLIVPKSYRYDVDENIGMRVEKYFPQVLTDENGDRLGLRAVAHLELAKVFFQNHRYEEAKQELRNIFCILSGMDPNWSEFAAVHAWLGIVYFQCGEIEEAKLSCEEALRIDSSNEMACQVMKKIFDGT